jgi:hypothetical protein
VRRIPVHQIWLQGADALPGELRGPTSRWRDAAAARPEFRYRLWNEEAMLGSLERIPFPGIRHIYHRVPRRLVGIRADIARLVILYDQGGLYIDADTRPLRPERLLDHVAGALRHSEAPLVGVADLRGWTPAWVRWTRRPSNFLLAARPRSAFVARYLERIIDDYQRLDLERRLPDAAGSGWERRLTKRWTGPGQLRRGIARDPEDVQLTPIGFVSCAGQGCFPEAALAHDYASRWCPRPWGWRLLRDAGLRVFLSTPIDGLLLGLLAATLGIAVGG